MTALASSLRPRGLTWSVLATHRTALRVWTAFVVLGVIGLVGLYLYGEHVQGLREACPAAGKPPCVGEVADRLSEAAHRYHRFHYLAGAVLNYLPLAVAAFAGGSLAGRETESGTAMLSWSQSVSPTRWLSHRLAVPALLLTGGTTLLAVLYRWASTSGAPRLGIKWYDPQHFTITGPVGPAHVLLALLVGAVAGLLVQRALAGLGIGLGAMLLIHVAGLRYRSDLWPKVTWTGDHPLQLPGDAQLFGMLGVMTESGERISREGCYEAGHGLDILDCMEAVDGRHLHAVIHPSSHYWPLQLVETGIVLGLAAVLTVFAFWLLRRRLP